MEQVEGAESIDAAKPPLPRGKRGVRSWCRGRNAWDLFLQFFAVMLGVSVATGVASWREERSLKALEQRALQNIANEIALNLERTQLRRDYYYALAEEVGVLLSEKGEQASFSDLKGFRGLNPLILRRSSFDMGIRTQALGHSRYDLAEQIADAYALQDWVYGGMSKWMDYIILHSEGFQIPLRDLGMIMQDWSSMCDELLALYASLQKALPEPVLNRAVPGGMTGEGARGSGTSGSP